MKKLILSIIVYIVMFVPAIASGMDLDSMYDDAEMFKSKLYNNIDPFEDEDNIRYAWSPYPLFRTSAYLYFKDLVIEPGYYILTPRTLGGKDYILFKQNGKVEFIVPIVKKESTPMNFYEANTPKVKMTKWQSFAAGVRKKFYDTAKDSMRSTPPNSLVNVEVETKYIILILYYGESKYTAIFRRTPY